MLYLGEERSPRQQDVLDHRDKVLIEQAAEPFTLRVCLPRASSHHGDIIHTLLLRAESYGQAVERVLLNCFLMQPYHFNCPG